MTLLGPIGNRYSDCKGLCSIGELKGGSYFAVAEATVETASVCPVRLGNAGNGDCSGVSDGFWSRSRSWSRSRIRYVYIVQLEIDPRTMNTRPCKLQAHAKARPEARPTSRPYNYEAMRGVVGEGSCGSFAAELAVQEEEEANMCKERGVSGMVETSRPYARRCNGRAFI